jgi:hypothetical protein
MPKRPLFVKLVCPLDVVPLLGKVSDRSIARDRGFHPETVQVWRRERGIKPWRQPKRSRAELPIHPCICKFCGEQFTVIGGRPDRLRRTCPAPKLCQGKLARKTLTLANPARQLNQISALLGMHFITDKDD